MKPKRDLGGLGSLIVIAIVAAIAFGLYRGVDSIGWIPHTRDSIVTAQANWFVGERKNCVSFPLDAEIAHDGDEARGYAFARIACDDGPERSVKVTFYGQAQQPGHAWFSWQCVRNQDSFVCKQTGSSREIKMGKLTGVYAGEVRNTTAQLSAPFEIQIQEYPESVLSGCMSVHRPLYGSGGLAGSSGASQITFEVRGPVGIIRFTGTREGGDIKGSYSVQRSGVTEYGQFELHRQGELPTYFSANNCPDDSIIH